MIPCPNCQPDVPCPNCQPDVIAEVCESGKCAYDNFCCPNGCPEVVELDEPAAYLWIT